MNYWSCPAPQIDNEQCGTHEIENLFFLQV